MKKLLINLATWVLKVCAEKPKPVAVLKKRHWLTGCEEFSESFREHVRNVWVFIKASNGDVVPHRGASVYFFDAEKPFAEYGCPGDSAEPPVAPIGDFTKSPINGLHGQSI